MNHLAKGLLASMFLGALLGAGINIGESRQKKSDDAYYSAHPKIQEVYVYPKEPPPPKPQKGQLVLDDRHTNPGWNIHDATDVAGYIYLKGATSGHYQDCDYKFEPLFSTVGDIGFLSGRMEAKCKDSWEMKKYSASDPPTHINRVNRITRYRWNVWGGAKSGLTVESVGTDGFGNPCKDEWGDCESRGGVITLPAEPNP